MKSRVTQAADILVRVGKLGASLDASASVPDIFARCRTRIADVVETGRCSFLSVINHFDLVIISPDQEESILNELEDLYGHCQINGLESRSTAHGTTTHTVVRAEWSCQTNARDCVLLVYDGDDVNEHLMVLVMGYHQSPRICLYAHDVWMSWKRPFEESWRAGVAPQVMDPENVVRDLAIALTMLLLFSNLIHLEIAVRGRAERSRFIWGLSDLTSVQHLLASISPQ